ncbi:hypothetical protein MTR_3g437610 [Medicago truncatula]|uniref:Uncharacterized protein n=1 Tax=Medicago truncatula TaxID=3880 RepID=A0A072UWI7_MEDTR|nr:hypothetical protein MTR_3g437610 [Medicago truncatula]
MTIQIKAYVSLEVSFQCTLITTSSIPCELIQPNNKSQMPRGYHFTLEVREGVSFPPSFHDHPK